MSASPARAALDRALESPEASGEAVRFDLEAEEGAPAIESIVAQPRGAHWLFATYGLTRLDEEPAAPRRGYELVLRVPVDGTASAAPEGSPRVEAPAAPLWPVELLRAVASYLESTGAELADGHTVDVGGPIARDVETKLTAVVAVNDPAIAPFETPFGPVRLLELVGIAADEHDLLLDWSVAGLIELLARDNPLLVTDLRRESILETALASEARARAEREGSSLERLSADLRVQMDDSGRVASVAVGPTAVGPLRRVLKSRLGHQKTVTIDGSAGVLQIVPGEEPGWTATDDGVRLTLPAEVALDWQEELAEQPPEVPRAFVQDFWVVLSAD